MREEEIIWFGSRRIVTAVRRVEPCLRFAQISAKISPIVDGGGTMGEKKKNGTGERTEWEGGCKGAAGNSSLET